MRLPPILHSKFFIRNSSFEILYSATRPYKNFAPPFGGAGFYYWMCAARTLRGKSSIGKVQRRLQEVQRWQARTTESRFSPAHPVNPHFSLIRMHYRTDCEKFLNVTAM